MKRTDQSLAAEAKFHARVQELGGEVLEPEWLGVMKPHRVRCKAGHECAPWPVSVNQGAGLCKVCARTDSRIPEAEFRAAVAAQGGVLLEERWLGNHRPHRIMCRFGHQGAPTPKNVRKGLGICATCGRLKRGTAKPKKVIVATESTRQQRKRQQLGELRSFVEARGGVLLAEEWLGNDTPHSALCPEEHACKVRLSNFRKGLGMCRACAGQDPAIAEAAFRRRVEEDGGEVLEPEWLGVHSPHRTRCREGHESAPTPSSVRNGGGTCRVCRGYAWDAFYVIANEVEQRFKIGVSSGDPSRRMASHRPLGYTTTIRVVTSLPGTVAPDLERTLINELPRLGHAPVSGREFFAIDALPSALDIVDEVLQSEGTRP